jgi:hypothetical protein
MTRGTWENPDAGMPCRLCGAARSCDYRTVAAPVPPVEKTQPNAHKKNLKVGQERKSRYARVFRQRHVVENP